MCVKN